MTAVRKKGAEDTALGGILPGLVQDRGWEVQMDLRSFFPHWQELMEPDVALHSRPVRIAKATLWLEVDNSAWLQQLRFQKVTILEIINGYLKKSQLRDIRFTLPDGGEAIQTVGEKVRFQAPSAEEISGFEDQIAYIEDQAIRDALMRFWYLSKACIREK